MEALESSCASMCRSSCSISSISPSSSSASSWAAFSSASSAQIRASHLHTCLAFKWAASGRPSSGSWQISVSSGQMQSFQSRSLSSSAFFSHRRRGRRPLAIVLFQMSAGQGNEQSVDLVHVNGATLTSLEAMNLPKPLSISDLSPAPLHGSSLRVAYQGVPGAYSEAAAGKAYPNCEPVPCDQFEAAFQAVELWLADRAVLPVENSLGGSIHRNYDLLLRHRLHIVGEVQLPVHHCLLAMPGVSKAELKRVISHPQALAQCEHTLTRLGLNVAREAVDDTAGAAQFIAENNIHDTAAIASSRAADIYGMNILAEGIQDDSGNVTRFVMLAREPIIPRVDRPFKTSIVFANEEATGSLFKILAAFAFRDINLTKIESRPQRKKPLRIVDDTNNGKAKYFEYLFYIDFEASMADPRAQNALAELQEFTSFLRVLGSYPMDMTPLVRSPPL
ncbi:hypothetical protein GOP47_0011862 [Adiantum capillus-veneris]|uniref:Arogenate dehydratase n=1 Tax=Adiantum capillus-veneris TaxID=13818 RepID=A0A9D4UTJ7_ADICA|nr:hypothetical protein GOP47_0011862 [Adiantum capillus-veneris]